VTAGAEVPVKEKSIQQSRWLPRAVGFFILARLRGESGARRVGGVGTAHPLLGMLTEGFAFRTPLAAAGCAGLTLCARLMGRNAPPLDETDAAIVLARRGILC